MITTRPLIPSSTGYAIRMYNFLKILKYNNIHVTLISFCDDLEQKMLLNMQQELKIIADDFIPIPHNRKTNILKMIKAFFMFKSLRVESYNTKIAREIINSTIKNNNYDYVCGYTYLVYQFLSKLPKEQKKWIDLSESVAMLQKRHSSESKSFLPKILSMIESPRVLRVERDCVKNANVTFISDIDKNYVTQSDKKTVTIVKNGTNVTNLFSETYNRNEIIYLGDMSYVQNKEAVTFFIKEILPDLVSKNQNIYFKIIGKNPSKELIELGKYNDHIKVTGEVNDVLKEMINACLMVCPIYISSGLQNKILESMSIGVPVIATSNVAVPITRDTNILLQANTKQEWISQIYKVMDSQDLRMSLAYKSKEFISNNFSWNSINKDLMSIFK